MVGQRRSVKAGPRSCSLHPPTVDIQVVFPAAQNQPLRLLQILLEPAESRRQFFSSLTHNQSSMCLYPPPNVGHSFIRAQQDRHRA